MLNEHVMAIFFRSREFLKVISLHTMSLKKAKKVNDRTDQRLLNYVSKIYGQRGNKHSDHIVVIMYSKFVSRRAQCHIHCVKVRHWVKIPEDPTQTPSQQCKGQLCKGNNSIQFSYMSYYLHLSSLKFFQMYYRCLNYCILRQIKNISFCILKITFFSSYFFAEFVLP